MSKEQNSEIERLEQRIAELEESNEIKDEKIEGLKEAVRELMAKK